MAKSDSLESWSLRGSFLPRHQFELALAATLTVCVYLFIWALGTLPVIGDESHHFRRAIGYWETAWPQFRITHDPAYPPEGQCAIQYWEAAGWHLSLALIWKLMGHPSFLVAQVYHLCYLFALGIFTWLAARELFGNRGAWWSWALAMTLPVNLLFGTLLYVEVPEAAMVALAVYAILRQRPLWLGVALAGMFYIKLPSATVLAPPIILASLLKIHKGWRMRLANTILACGVAFLLLMPDLVWRFKHFGSPIIYHATEVIGPRIVYPMISQLPPVKQSAIPLNILDPYVCLQNFGISGILAGFAAIGWSVWALGKTFVRIWRNLWSAGIAWTLRTLPDQVAPEVAVASIPLLGYFLAYVVLMRMAYDVRYFHPAMLFVALVGGGILSRLRPLKYVGAHQWLVRLGGWMLILAMLGQAVCVPRVVHYSRILPPTTVAGYEWIKKNTPQMARVLYLEYNLTALTKRPIVWAAALPRYLFSVPEQEQMRVLCGLEVEYIAIHPTRVIDQLEPTIEPMGYPRPWVESLRNRPYLTQVFPESPNPAPEGQFILFRIDKDKIPPEWMKEPPAKAKKK